MNISHLLASESSSQKNDLSSDITGERSATWKPVSFSTVLVPIEESTANQGQIGTCHVNQGLNGSSPVKARACPRPEDKIHNGLPITWAPKRKRKVRTRSLPYDSSARQGVKGKRHQCLPITWAPKKRGLVYTRFLSLDSRARRQLILVPKGNRSKPLLDFCREEEGGNNYIPSPFLDELEIERAAQNLISCLTLDNGDPEAEMITN